MFLHDYLLACEISTVRTQTLRVNAPTFIIVGFILVLMTVDLFVFSLNVMKTVLQKSQYVKHIYIQKKHALSHFQNGKNDLSFK